MWLEFRRVLFRSEDGEYDKAMQIYADALQLAKEHQAYNVAGYICAYMACLLYTSSTG